MGVASQTLNMRVLVLVSCLVVAMAHPDFSDSWEEFKGKYGKDYPDTDEEAYRQNVWADNVKFISSHNAEYKNGVHDFSVGENEFADMTHDEITSYFNGLAMDESSPSGQTFYSDVSLGSLPTEMDWRKNGSVTPVKNQGHCGSCWAFSATGSLEGAHFLKTGKLVSLSEQNLVDCSRKEGNLGCMGGIMDKAFEYVIKNKGIDTESSYPYTAVTGKVCKYKQDNVGATISSFKDIPTNSEADLMNAVATIGPISVAIDASKPTFHFYKSGVYFDRKCSSTHLDHGVLAVGYGADDNGESYWIVKNSWGVKWGDKGYIKMAKDKNNACGIARQASYPVA